jgi:preprotein translocase subunit SecE
VRENLPRPTAPSAPAPGTGKAASRKPSPFAVLGRLKPRFAADIISELRKVTWPTFSETRYLTMVVALVSIAIGLILGGADYIFGWAVGRLFF